MEQKPIKRSPHIQQLSKDHHYTLLFCWKIRQGLKANIAAERINKYVHHFWQSHMMAHFREEEEILFLPVKDEKVKKAIDEHQQIKDLVAATTLQAAETEAQIHLSTLADLVDRHVRYEERELFPHLEKTLTNEQLEAIGKQLQMEQPSPLKDDFEDEFWLAKN